MASLSPLIAIVGETASGKSSLAVDLAKRFDGEIIAADSRTVYRGMDIGTAKANSEDRSTVPHHLIDIATPDEPYNAAKFQSDARKAIEGIASRGKLPILVGGTGLYVDAILFNYRFSGVNAPRSKKNPRHLLDTVALDRLSLRPNTLVLGITLERDILKQRVIERVEAMVRQGLPQEVLVLSEGYGWDNEALTAVGYKEWRDYFSGQKNERAVVEEIIKNTLVYAKRQKTWFKRNKNIHWLTDPSNAVDIVTTFLNNLDNNA